MDDLPDINSFLSKYKERIQSQQEDIRRLKTELAEAVKERDSFKTSCERSFLMNRESIEHLLTKLELMVDSSHIFEGKEQQRAKMTEGVGTIVDVVQQMQQRQLPQPATEMTGLVMPMSPLAATAESSALTLSLSSPSASLLEGMKPEREPEPEQMTEHVEEVYTTESKKKRRGGKKKKKYEEEVTDEFGQMMEMQEEEEVVAAVPPPSSPLRVGSPSQPKMLEIERRTIAVTGNPSIEEGAGQSETLDEYINAAFAKMGTGLEGERSVSPGVTVYPESPRVVSLTKVTTNVPALAKAIEQRQSSSGSEEKAARLLIESKKEKQQERGGGSNSSSPRIEELTGAELAAAEGSPRITPQMVTPAAEQASNPWQVVAPNILETIVSGLELKDVTGEAFV